MIIKKFQGKTESEAIEAAKKDLGENIVIMNVRNMKKKSFFGLIKSPFVEVTVALEPESQKTQAPIQPKEASKPIVPESVWKREEIKQPTIWESAPSDDTGKAIVEKLDGLQSLLQQQLNKSEREAEKFNLREEKEVKEDKQSQEIINFMKLIYNAMIKNEVIDQYANELIDEIQRTGKADMQMDMALANVYQKMILKFGQASLIEPSEKKPKLIYFVGPTGVGKTTTIAKLASKFSLEEKKKIALLTSDTYRIAAVEQLRTYANILEVPFRIVYSPEEIKEAVKEFNSVDYILVDTSGHAHQNEEQINTTREFINAAGEEVEKEVFLVLSATTKYRDLTGIADAYVNVHDFKLIFTKLDETSALGNLYNLRMYTGAPLSYVTWGQNVPEDVSAFNPQTAVKQILGGN